MVLGRYTETGQPTPSGLSVTNLARQAISAAGAAVTLATWWLILVSAAAATIILRA